MDSDPSAPEMVLPEVDDLPSHLLYRIAMATTSDQVVDALRDYAAPEIDRICLTGVGLLDASEVVAVWDRDEVAVEDGLPGPIRQLVGRRPLIISSDIHLNQSAALFRAYVEGTLRARASLFSP